ncbi:hypothetical protein LTR92_009916 [Exophiala xenobiotica]|nr:hypothetical protein LTR92_009916 [Exophiala xenobiotica]
MSTEQHRRMRRSSRDTPYQATTAKATKVEEIERLAPSLQEADKGDLGSSSSSRSRRRHGSNSSQSSNKSRSRRGRGSRNPLETSSPHDNKSKSNSKQRSSERSNNTATNTTTNTNKNNRTTNAGLKAWQRSAESVGGRQNIKSDKRVYSPSASPVRNGRVEKPAHLNRGAAPCANNNNNYNNIRQNNQNNQDRHSQTHNLDRPQAQAQAGYNETTKTTTPRVRNTRITPTHILFWSGPLSNWNVGAPFSGRRAMDLLIPRLDVAKIAHPSRNALSTQLMSRHDFVCGEQFMMACKGWLFERERMIKGCELEVDTAGLEEPGVVDRICEDILECGSWGQRPNDGPKKIKVTVKLDKEKQKVADGANVKDADVEVEIDIDIDYEGMSNGTIVCAILSPNPRDQKAIGRRTKGFNEAIWTRASFEVVVAGCIARAEVDLELREVYTLCQYQYQYQYEYEYQKFGPGPDQQGQQGQQGRRKFVEGSPMDKIWGIGLRWDDPRADDERNWKGGNRLGRCHDVAAEWMRLETQ